MSKLTPRDPPLGTNTPASTPMRVKPPAARKPKTSRPNVTTNVLTHPTSVAAKHDRVQERENLARQLRSNQMMREQAREMIQPSQLISEIQDIGIELMPPKDIAGNMIPMEQTLVTALRARADIKFRLLSKVLPDLKATESISHSTHDHVHAHAHTTVNNMELATRLQLWRRQHGMEPLEDVIATIEPDAEPMIDLESTKDLTEGCTDATFDIEEFL